MQLSISHPCLSWYTIIEINHAMKNHIAVLTPAEITALMDEFRRLTTYIAALPPGDKKQALITEALALDLTFRQYVFPEPGAFASDAVPPRPPLQLK